MNRLQKLQAERDHKARSAKDIIDRAQKDSDRPLTGDECDLFDRLNGEIETLDAQISALVETEKRRQSIDATIRRLDEPAGRATTPDQPAKPADRPAATFVIPATARASGKLRAFTGRDANERAYRAGMWCRAVLFRDERAAHWCHNNGVGVGVRNTLSTTSNPDGGHLVPDEMASAIIDLREQFGVFRREARVWPMGSDTLDIPARAGGVTIGPLGENPSAAPTESSPTFGQRKLVAKKAGGLTKMSTEIAEDAVMDLADWVAEEYAYGFASFEDDCGFIGDGSSTYLGIRGLENLLTESSGLAGAVLAASGHDTLLEIDTGDIALAMAKLPQYAKMNAKFYCSSTVVELVFNRLKAAAGGNTVQTLAGAPGDNYLGYPIVVSQKLEDSTGTINSTAIFFFGDLRKSSALGDRRQVRVFPSEHRGMDLDQLWILGTERIDILNHDIGDTTTPGPIVALLGNT